MIIVTNNMRDFKSKATHASEAISRGAWASDGLCMIQRGNSECVGVVADFLNSKRNGVLNFRRER